MKVLVFSDIHGGLNSLNKLIETDDFKSADKIIFLGDVLMGCSRPNECVELLNDFKIECLLGNNDYYVCDHIPDCDLKDFDTVKMAQLQYMRSILSKKSIDIIKTWEKELYLSINGKKFYFIHYPFEKNINDYSVVDVSDTIDLKKRRELFKDINADYIFFGHEHKSSVFKDDKKTYYCLGTMSLKVPGDYLLIDIVDNEVVINEKQLYFDIDEEIELMDKAGYPYSKNTIKNI